MKLITRALSCTMLATLLTFSTTTATFAQAGTPFGAAGAQPKWEQLNGSLTGLITALIQMLTQLMQKKPVAAVAAVEVKPQPNKPSSKIFAIKLVFSNSNLSPSKTQTSTTPPSTKLASSMART